MFRGPTHRLFRGLRPRRVPLFTCRPLWTLANRVVPIPIVGLQIAIVIAYNLLGFSILTSDLSCIFQSIDLESLY